MQYRRFLLAAGVVCLSVSGCGRDRPAPSDFGPLMRMLGKWTGQAEIITTDHRGDTPVSYKKTTECKVSEDGDAFLMIDTELDPWTNESVTTTAVIRSDHTSGSFKATVSGSDGTVRRFLMTVSDNTIDYELVDQPDDVKFTSTVRFQDDGTMREEGFRSGEKPTPYAVMWTVQYTRDHDDISNQQAVQTSN